MSNQNDENVELGRKSQTFDQPEEKMEFNPDKIVVHTASGTIEVEIPKQRNAWDSSATQNAGKASS